MPLTRLIVFISGSGSNLQAILDAAANHTLPVEVVLIVSNRKDAYGLVRAAQAGVPTLYFPLKPYKDAGRGRDQYDADLAAQVSPYQPDLIVLAGWMHVLSPAFLNHFPRQVINLHPALPDTFAGTHAIERAYEAFQRGEISHSGCMVHTTIPEVDAGPVIAQAIVPIYPTDSLDDFATRMHQAEHTLLVEAIGAVISPPGVG
ncbi:MAG: phosphoribosylglycinamide formyltransferase [Chloroflexi bacterium]|nr:phosphoribosylglycinamide formyltransferase [Chloroflexota bacterium]